MIPLITELLASGHPAQVVAGVLLLAGGVAFALCGIALAMIDLAEHRLPNRIIYPWAAATVALVMVVSFLLTDPTALLRAGASGVLWGGFFLLLRVLVKSSVGLGDAKLAVVLGMYSGFLGWDSLLAAVAISLLAGGFVAIAAVLTRGGGANARIAFGPCLIFGTAVAMLIS